jgi:hypothetical protein
MVLTQLVCQIFKLIDLNDLFLFILDSNEFIFQEGKRVWDSIGLCDIVWDIYMISIQNLIWFACYLFQFWISPQNTVLVKVLLGSRSQIINRCLLISHHLALIESILLILGRLLMTKVGLRAKQSIVHCWKLPLAWIDCEPLVVRSNSWLHELLILRLKFLNSIFHNNLLALIDFECRNNRIEIIPDHFYLHWFLLLILITDLDIIVFGQLIEYSLSVFPRKEWKQALHELSYKVMHMFGC